MMYLAAYILQEKVCQMIRDDNTKTLFASEQCTGEHGTLTEEMCLPSISTIKNEARKKMLTLHK